MLNTNWILTFTGKHFNPFNPELDDINIVDIAHALSNICRFTGHVKEFYSVAEHSVLVAELVARENPELALRALLHDASEAYLCDIAKPIKDSDELDVYCVIESKLQTTIDYKFNVLGGKDEIKKADEVLLNIEAYHLMPDCEYWWMTTSRPKNAITIKNWTPKQAKAEFLKAFAVYGGK